MNGSTGAYDQMLRRVAGPHRAIPRGHLYQGTPPQKSFLERYRDRQRRTKLLEEQQKNRRARENAALAYYNENMRKHAKLAEEGHPVVSVNKFSRGLRNVLRHWVESDEPNIPSVPLMEKVHDPEGARRRRERFREKTAHLVVRSSKRFGEYVPLKERYEDGNLKTEYQKPGVKTYVLPRIRKFK